MIQVLSVVAYALLVHTSIWLVLPYLQIVAIIVLATGILFKGLCVKDKVVWSVWALIVFASLLLGSYDIALYVLYLPPVLLPLLFFAVFFYSLMPGREPLVTDIGEKARGPLSAEMRDYTRKVTQLWAVMFLLVLLLGIGLPIWATDFVWSLFTNFINYFLIGVLFIGEYIFRKQRFPDHDHPTFGDYLKIVVNAKVAGRK